MQTNEGMVQYDVCEKLIEIVQSTDYLVQPNVVMSPYLVILQVRHGNYEYQSIINKSK